MEKRIKKRAPLYGIAAVLLAIVLAAACYDFGVYQPEPESPEPPSPTPSAGLLNTFSSDEELRSFLKANSATQGTFVFLGPWDLAISEDVRVYLEPLGSEIVTAPFMSPTSTQDLEFQHSLTNIQVAGVDEADIVKTDGEYLYFTSGHDVFILKAYPPGEAKILSKITLNDTYPAEIFIGPNSNRLAVLGSKHVIPLWRAYGQYFVDIKTFVNVYDISNKTNPTFLRNFTISGSYFNSRMIGEYVYLVVSQPAYIIYDTVILPKIYSSDGIKEISATEIHYYNVSDNYYTFTTVVALNMQNTEEEPTNKTIMMGGTSSMYVSLNNVYITFPELDGNTSIYRIRIENSTINPEATGKVPGLELNQFSMDEHNNYFRIATTTRMNGTTQNNLYVLDMNLSVVGRLENIAPDEAIDSVRFIGNRCYLATSIVRRDPFFVIDVENASDPRILGYLKIPGFTRYLHPYDENHIIGIGKDENDRVKILLFDVNNVSAPIEKCSYTVEGTWSDTAVLTEHKTFLFEKSKDLLAIPVSVYDWDKYSQWQGIYVFNITLSGLTLKGNVTHLESGISGGDSRYLAKRSLYIEDVLYTMSDKKVMMNKLQDLVLIKEIDLH